MKLTAKQALMLFEICKDTLIFYQRKDGDPFSFNHDTRTALVNEILNQQSTEIKDLSE